MPTYGYQCTQCDNAFETVQKITDDPLTTCEACGGTLRKKIFPVGIAFKGSGFYVNDYAKSGQAKSTDGASDKSASEMGADALAAAPGGDKAASDKTQSVGAPDSTPVPAAAATSPSPPAPAASPTPSTASP